MGPQRQDSFRERMKKDIRERKAIDKKVTYEDMRPSEKEGKIVQDLLRKISSEFTSEVSKKGFTDDVIEKLKKSIKYFCEQYAEEENLGYEEIRRIEQIALSNIIGHGPITTYLDDDSVTEIIVLRYDKICIERNGKIESVDAAFLDENHLRTIINRIVGPVGRAINLQTPMVDARLEDGSRVNATVPPASPDGATLTIRKFFKTYLQGEDYLNYGSLNEDMLHFLSNCVKGKISMIVSGGTGTGKTTLLNMLSSYIPKDELIITIEDSCELKLNQPNVRRLETRVSNSEEHMFPVTIQSLVKNSLRMRPDRIIVGEIRDHTIVDMMSAMSTGHEGSMSTVHAMSPQNLVNTRLPILYGQNKDVSFSIESQAIQISEALDLIIQISRVKDGDKVKRVLTHITHVAGINEEQRVELHDIFKYDLKTGEFYATGYIPEDIIDKLEKNGINIDYSIFDKDKPKNIQYNHYSNDENYNNHSNNRSTNNYDNRNSYADDRYYIKNRNYDDYDDEYNNSAYDDNNDYDDYYEDRRGNNRGYNSRHRNRN